MTVRYFFVHQNQMKLEILNAIVHIVHRHEKAKTIKNGQIFHDLSISFPDFEVKKMEPDHGHTSTSMGGKAMGVSRSTTVSPIFTSTSCEISCFIVIRVIYYGNTVEYSGIYQQIYQKKHVVHINLVNIWLNFGKSVKNSIWQFAIMTGNLGNMSKTTKITKGSDKILKENRVNGGFCFTKV